MQVLKNRKHCKRPVILCIDANSRLGSVLSTAVGAEEEEQECGNGELFHSLLLDMDLFLPSTFWGGGKTWKSSRTELLGRRRRLDFVGLPLDWFHSVLRTYVSTDTVLDIGEREDHRMPVVEVDLTPVKTSSQWKRRPAMGVNRAAF